jgi:hypothetical protein
VQLRQQRFDRPAVVRKEEVVQRANRRRARGRDKSREALGGAQAWSGGCSKSVTRWSHGLDSLRQDAFARLCGGLLGLVLLACAGLIDAAYGPVGQRAATSTAARAGEAVVGVAGEERQERRDEGRGDV